MNKIERIITFANTITDKRKKKKINYPLSEILLTVFVGVLAGCKGWDGIEDLCKSKIASLKKILPFENNFVA